MAFIRSATNVMGILHVTRYSVTRYRLRGKGHKPASDVWPQTGFHCLNLGLFCHLQGVVTLNAEIAYGALELLCPPTVVFILLKFHLAASQP
jgi:hypothetical protein